MIDFRISIKLQKLKNHSSMSHFNVNYAQEFSISGSDQMLKKWLGMALITPILTFIIWVFNSHTIITYLNILFYVSLIIFISIFLILLVQEGIFDATSYGFRRLKYQMSSSKKKKSISDDPFFNPQEVKKEHYFVSTWIIPLLLINILYFIMTIVLSLILV